LIDGVTYVKAAEVIRMLRLVLGRERFLAGKALYFTRYHNGNANTDQFFRCFEEVSGISLEQFKREWLYRIGYPKVTAKTEYRPSSRQYVVRFRQELREGQAPFHLPIELALVDRRGKDIQGTATVFQLKEAEGEEIFESIEEPPALASMNRDYSFYGTFRNEDAGPELLSDQVRLDPNVYNRVDAMRYLTDLERIRLLRDPDGAVSDGWLALYGDILADPGVAPSTKAYFLRIDEQPMDRSYATWYQELVVARERLMLAVNRSFRGLLLQEFRRLDTYRVPVRESCRTVRSASTCRVTRRANEKELTNTPRSSTLP